MTITNYDEWVRDGSPWHPAKPIADLAETLRKHGVTVYVIGAVDTHLNIATPEDHAPFSHTPWPGSQPYPAVLAEDFMPGAGYDWRELGRRIVADKLAGVHGTEWIKYINWTDADGNCWHDSWQPDHERRASTDRGHVHISGRTDYVDSDVAINYDPLAFAPISNPTPGGGDSGKLAEDGQLGPLTIRVWQRRMGTPMDGVITAPWTNPPGKSSLVMAVQRYLNQQIHAGLSVDGVGIRQDGRSVFATTRALQRYLGTPSDGVLSSPVSQVVRSLQRHLNDQTF